MRKYRQIEDERDYEAAKKPPRGENKPRDLSTTSRLPYATSDMPSRNYETR